MAVIQETALPTPTLNESLSHKVGGFATLTDALDYAARGETGYNFYELRGGLACKLPYAEVREKARALASKLAAKFKRGDRIALVAETSPEFAITFFACQYAGLIPAPMPSPATQPTVISGPADSLDPATVQRCHAILSDPRHAEGTLPVPDRYFLNSVCQPI